MTGQRVGRSSKEKITSQWEEKYKNRAYVQLLSEKKTIIRIQFKKDMKYSKDKLKSENFAEVKLGQMFALYIYVYVYGIILSA